MKTSERKGGVSFFRKAQHYVFGMEKFIGDRLIGKNEHLKKGESHEIS